MISRTFVLVENKRIELLTPCVQSRCSPSWANSPYVCQFRDMLCHCFASCSLTYSSMRACIRSRSSPIPKLTAHFCASQLYDMLYAYPKIYGAFLRFSFFEYYAFVSAYPLLSKHIQLSFFCFRLRCLSLNVTYPFAYLPKSLILRARRMQGFHEF